MSSVWNDASLYVRGTFRRRYAVIILTTPDILERFDGQMPHMIRVTSTESATTRILKILQSSVIRHGHSNDSSELLFRRTYCVSKH